MLIGLPVYLAHRSLADFDLCGQFNECGTVT